MYSTTALLGDLVVKFFYRCGRFWGLQLNNKCILVYCYLQSLLEEYNKSFLSIFHLLCEQHTTKLRMLFFCQQNYANEIV